MLRNVYSQGDKIVMVGLEDTTTKTLDETVFDDLDTPELFIEKKKKPHHAKRRKGWER